MTTIEHAALAALVSAGFSVRARPRAESLTGWTHQLLLDGEHYCYARSREAAWREAEDLLSRTSVEELLRSLRR